MDPYEKVKERLKDAHIRFGEEFWSDCSKLEDVLNDCFPGSDKKSIVLSFVACLELIKPTEPAMLKEKSLDLVKYQAVLDSILGQSPIHDEFVIGVLDACLYAMGINHNRMSIIAKLAKPFVETEVLTDLAEIVSKATSGKIIRLKAGTYYLTQTLKITKPLQIIGAGVNCTRIINISGKEILEYDCADKLVLADLVFSQISKGIKAASLKIKNGIFEMNNCAIREDIEGGFQAPALLLEQSQGVIENCYVAGSSGDGICLKNESSFVIKAVTVENNAENGIIVENSRIWLCDCLITRNGNNGIDINSRFVCEVSRNKCIENQNNGISIKCFSAPKLVENYCCSNSSSGIAYRGESGGEARGNICTENNQQGIYLDGKASPELLENKCNRNDGCGIAFFGESSGAARNNCCEENKQDGIYLDGNSAPELEGNECNRNDSGGIFYHGESRGAARSNCCEANKRSGIYLGGKAAPELIENRCNRNDYSGISYWGMSGGEARGNVCEGNKQNGIYLDESASPELIENECNCNDGSGIAYFGERGGTAYQRERGGESLMLWDYFRGEASANCCKWNGNCGIYVSQCASTKLIENKCISNLVSGIAFRGGSDGEVKGNLCEHNVEDGISLGESAEAIIFENHCHRNGMYGIFFRDVSRGGARDNICKENGKEGIGIEDNAAPILEGNECIDNGVNYQQLENDNVVLAIADDIMVRQPVKIKFKGTSLRVKGFRRN